MTGPARAACLFLSSPGTLEVAAVIGFHWGAFGHQKGKGLCHHHSGHYSSKTLHPPPPMPWGLTGLLRWASREGPALLQDTQASPTETPLPLPPGSVVGQANDQRLQEWARVGLLLRQGGLMGGQGFEGSRQGVSQSKVGGIFQFTLVDKSRETVVEQGLACYAS